MQDREFVCFNNQRTKGGGTVKLACFDAKRRTNLKSDTSRGRTRINLEGRITIQGLVLISAFLTVGTSLFAVKAPQRPGTIVTCKQEDKPFE